MHLLQLAQVILVSKEHVANSINVARKLSLRNSEISSEGGHRVEVLNRFFNYSDERISEVCSVECEECNLSCRRSENSTRAELVQRDSKVS